MIPKSLSATALQTFTACPARFKAEKFDLARGVNTNTAAWLGSSVHGALELYVKACYLDHTQEPSEKLLLDFFKMSYAQIFGSYDYDTVEYMEGYKMLTDWFKRTSFEGVEVQSCEIKTFFNVPTSAGDIPFNYIWDRFDKIRDGVYKVVDYKSNRWGIQPKDLKKKIQARAYGLACAIQLKADNIEYERIWVEFDMLRHQPVGISFSREEIAATWYFIKDSAEEILARGDDEFEERLNAECLFCPRKVSCDELKRNIVVGGIHSIESVEKAIDLRAQIEWQKKGLESLLKDLDAKILAEAQERDMTEFESDMNNLIIGRGQQRSVDAERVGHVIGPKLMEKYGGTSVSMANIDKLLKGKELTDEQKRDLRGLIFMKTGEPKIKVEPKNPIDDA